MAVTQQQEQVSEQQSGAEQRVQEYMLNSEEITYSLRFRPRGVINWFESLLGYGVTYWFITNERVIETTKESGGFTFRDVPHGKISSIEYGRKLSLVTIALGALLGFTGLLTLSSADAIGGLLLIVGLGLIGYAYFWRQQVLAIKASGGVSMVLNISKGDQIDKFIWYLHAERSKHTD
ncbi:hypothetical protein [Natronosalvus caseinilyticus]|uniref:hypothetical protein n=1 Tax=Natronosalvus caseinilyticus TaxID=2953747 RepID=UPI0028B088DC|nr:hypothetical protein [Natronosalvus caseinilyticus]